MHAVLSILPEFLTYFFNLSSFELLLEVMDLKRHRGDFSMPVLLFA